MSACCQLMILPLHNFLLTLQKTARALKYCCKIFPVQPELSSLLNTLMLGRERDATARGQTEEDAGYLKYKPTASVPRQADRRGSERPCASQKQTLRPRRRVAAGSFQKGAGWTCQGQHERWWGTGLARTISQTTNLLHGVKKKMNSKWIFFSSKVKGHFPLSAKEKVLFFINVFKEITMTIEASKRVRWIYHTWVHQQAAFKQKSLCAKRNIWHNSL